MLCVQQQKQQKQQQQNRNVVDGPFTRRKTNYKSKEEEEGEKNCTREIERPISRAKKIVQ